MGTTSALRRQAKKTTARRRTVKEVAALFTLHDTGYDDLYDEAFASLVDQGENPDEICDMDIIREMDRIDEEREKWVRQSA